MTISVVDIFAGPGGLGEGFSAFMAPDGSGRHAFKIAISAETNLHAWQTLRLRAFFRQFAAGEVPKSYYDYVAGRRPEPWTLQTRGAWNAASREACQLTLGNAADDQALDQRIKAVASSGRPWVLIGGPPCQAYSLVGRARNKGIAGYSAEGDHRHFLYRHYLTILRNHRPAAFIMENVKGILSSSVGGEPVFSRILDDLQRPGGRDGPRYRLLPLTCSTDDELLGSRSPSDYIVRAEQLGIPQARHRVILLGISEEVHPGKIRALQLLQSRVSVNEAIGVLPPLRSNTTGQVDRDWPMHAGRILKSAADGARREHPEVRQLLLRLAREARAGGDPGTGGRWTSCSNPAVSAPGELRAWYYDRNLRGCLNHETRSHMDEDLVRYSFAAAFAQLTGRSPKAVEYPASLAPEHANWNSGKFVDRFKVQVGQAPSSTVTSHLAKDGHYFIHPDPLQIRSLTVREAARLQTFPDNYFFEGSRGKQFHQVGNAVPPLLARQIAAVVHSAVAG